MIDTSLRRGFAFSAGLGLALWSATAQAALTQFTIDPAQSFLTLSGDVEGVLPITEQSPGSLTAANQGVILADVTPFGIAFPGGSLVDPLPKAGPFLPGNVAADYAGQAEVLTGVQAYAVIQDAQADVLGPGQPIDAAGEFSLATLSVSFTSGLFAFDALGFQDFFFLDPTPFAFNQTGAKGQILQSPGLTTLILPVSASSPVYSPELDLTLNLALQGVIVATAVPEPSTAALSMTGLLLGGGAFAARRRNRHRGN